MEKEEIMKKNISVWVRLRLVKHVSSDTHSLSAIGLPKLVCQSMLFLFGEKTLNLLSSEYSKHASSSRKGLGLELVLFLNTRLHLSTYCEGYERKKDREVGPSSKKRTQHVTHFNRNIETDSCILRCAHF